MYVNSNNVTSDPVHNREGEAPAEPLATARREPLHIPFVRARGQLARQNATEGFPYRSRPRHGVEVKVVAVCIVIGTPVRELAVVIPTI